MVIILYTMLYVHLDWGGAALNDAFKLAYFYI
jgi:hypothetical protein